MKRNPAFKTGKAGFVFRRFGIGLSKGCVQPMRKVNLNENVQS
jgi:hypothetical protein